MRPPPRWTWSGLGTPHLRLERSGRPGSPHVHWMGDGVLSPTVERLRQRLTAELTGEARSHGCSADAPVSWAPCSSSLLDMTGSGDHGVLRVRGSRPRVVGNTVSLAFRQRNAARIPAHVLPPAGRQSPPDCSSGLTGFARGALPTRLRKHGCHVRAANQNAAAAGPSGGTLDQG